MYYVYILKSKIGKHIYTGSTIDLRNRFKEHNDGKVTSTRPYKPWILIYYEAYSTESLARIREKRLKYNGNAIQELKKRIGLNISKEASPSTTLIHKKRGMHQSGAGFIALISVIIISAILLLVATTLGMSGFSTRLNIMNSEFKERSSALAESCFDRAILSLSLDPAYNPVNQTVNVGSETCTIVDMIGGAQKIINIKANYKGFFTNLQIRIDATDLSVISWQELP